MREDPELPYGYLGVTHLEKGFETMTESGEKKAGDSALRRTLVYDSCALPVVTLAPFALVRIDSPRGFFGPYCQAVDASTYAFPSGRLPYPTWSGYSGAGPQVLGLCRLYVTHIRQKCIAFWLLQQTFGGWVVGQCAVRALFRLWFSAKVDSNA